MITLAIAVVLIALASAAMALGILVAIDHLTDAFDTRRQQRRRQRRRYHHAALVLHKPTGLMLSQETVDILTQSGLDHDRK